MLDVSKRLKALKQERADLVTEQERTLATVAQASRAFTDDEKRRDDEIAARLDDLDDQLKRFDRLKQADRKAAVVTPADDRLAALFGGDPRFGFRHLGDFAASVYRASTQQGVDERLAKILAAPTGYMQETGGSAGEGYLIPTQFRQEIFEVIFDDEGLLPWVAPEPTIGNQVEFLKDETTPWGATGVQAAWRAEASQLSPSKAATKGGTIKLHELYAYVLSSEELLEDAPRLADRLTRKAGAAIRYKSEEAIVNGDGNGKPMGWANTNGPAVSVAKETSQTAATINGTNVAKMYSRLLPGGHSRANWIINSDAFPQLLLMTVGQQPVFVPPAAGFTQAPGGFLLGRPVRFSEHCQTIGTQGDVQYVDPMGYYAVNKGSGLQFASSIHLYFDYALTAFRWLFRLGGQPILSAAVSPAKGSATKSHFVLLDTRS